MPEKWHSLARNTSRFVNSHALIRKTGSRNTVLRPDGHPRYDICPAHLDQLKKLSEGVLHALAEANHVPQPEQAQPAPDPRHELYLVLSQVVELWMPSFEWDVQDDVELPLTPSEFRELVVQAIQADVPLQTTPQVEATANELPGTDGQIAGTVTEGLILGPVGERPRIGNETMAQLTVSQRDVLVACLEAGTAGLSLKELIAKSRHPDAPNILKRLRKKHSAWEAVIELAGKSGGQYRVRGRLVERPQ
ncbi:hypothetical protein B7486_07755 [cyanobacterium TDX16]|nr:hypothetical protein B7486_07755 [cyanobacterium TDX16]